MPYDKKNALNKSKKKIDKKKFIGKNVRVTKHFQPELIYHNKNFLQRDFPEVNSDFDIVESLSSIKTPNMKVHPSKNSLYKASSSVKTQFSKIDKPNSLHQKVSPPIPPFKKHNFESISCVEDRTSLYRENYKSVKSKSFVDVGSQSPKMSPLSSDIKTMNTDELTVQPSTEGEENPLDRLKKEIIINRIEGFRSFSSCSERKEKMEKIRRELSLLIHPANPNQKLIENKGIPFVEASKPMLIYNVNEMRNIALYSDKIVLENQRRVQNASQQLEEKETQGK